MEAVTQIKTFDISIHALREEGDCTTTAPEQRSAMISIHALREEGDRHGHSWAFHSPAISIHALREEGDCLPYRDLIIA